MRSQARANDVASSAVHDEASDGECVVCQENLRLDGENTSGPVVPFSSTCVHSFHRKCLEGWVRTRVRQGSDVTCPLCRQVNNAWIEEMAVGSPATETITLVVMFLGSFLVVDMEETE